MKLTVFSPDGTKSSEQDFAGLPTFDGDRGLQAVKEVIVAINANNRLGTHSTKTRAEVSGGGRKPWRQKGTGRARAGSNRSPLWSGGGVVFGPKPRDYSKKINGKVRALAFIRALFDRATAGEIAVIENFEIAPFKTKIVDQMVEERFALLRFPLLAEHPAQLQAGVKIIRPQLKQLAIRRDGSRRIIDGFKKIGQPFIKITDRNSVRQGGGKILAHLPGRAGLCLLLAQKQLGGARSLEPFSVVELRA